jgi:DNA-binding transcriptional ArsR family regulator
MTEIASAIVESISAPAPATGEVAPAPVAPAPAVDDDFAQRMAHLTKREKALVERQQSIKEVEERAKRYDSFKSRASSGDISAALEALEDLGVSYDALTSHLLTGQDPSTLRYKELEKKIEELKSDSEKQKEVELAAAQERAAQNYKLSISKEAQAKAEEFELVIEHGQEAIDLVYDVCKEYHDKNNGQMLDLSKALAAVEAHLASKAEETVQRFQKSKKLSRYFQPEQSRPANPFSSSGVQSPSPDRPTPSPTLSGGSSGATQANAVTPRSYDELRAAAIKALMG